MGTGAKIALVALLVVMVVVTAKIVQRSGGEDDVASTSGKGHGGSRAEKAGAAARKTVVGETSSSGKFSSSRTTPKKIFPREPSRPTSSRPKLVDLSKKFSTGARARTATPVPGTHSKNRRDEATDGGLAGRPGVSKETDPARQSKGSVSRSQSPSRESPGDGVSPADRLVQIRIAPAPDKKTTSPGEPRPQKAPASTASNDGFGRERDNKLVSDTDLGSLAAKSSGKAAQGRTSGGTGTAIVKRQPAGAVQRKGQALRRNANPGTFPVTYTVEPGDCYWELARKFYGDATHFTAIQDANNGVMPIAGKTLVIPMPPRKSSPAVFVVNSTAPALAAAVSTTVGTKGASGGPASTPSDGKFYYYTVERGETLGGIARKFYGKSSAYRRIQDSNRRLHYETLKAGEKIRIPR